MRILTSNSSISMRDTHTHIIVIILTPCCHLIFTCLSHLCQNYNCTVLADYPVQGFVVINAVLWEGKSRKICGLMWNRFVILKKNLIPLKRFLDYYILFIINYSIITIIIINLFYQFVGPKNFKRVSSFLRLFFEQKSWYSFWNISF